MNNFGGIKELYDVSLRLNQPLQIGDRKFDMNETILSFETAELAQINENKRSVQAKGGYNNNPLIDWTVDKEMGFAITHGVLSPTSWALLSNSKVKNPTIKSVSYKEKIHTIEDETYCYVELKYIPNSCQEKLGAQPNPDFLLPPVGRQKELLLKPLPPSKTKWIFCYDMETGFLIKNFTIYGNKIFFNRSYRNVMIDYTFDYEDRMVIIEVGNRLFNGFLRLDGKMSVKDWNSGKISTAILEMPKIKLSSNLSMKLGKSYDSSIVSDFYFTGYTDENERREQQKIANFTFLDTELMGDYI